MYLTRDEFNLLIDLVKERRAERAFSGYTGAGLLEYDYTKTLGLNDLLDKLENGKESSWQKLS